jgi:hypothetical protein
MVLRRNSADLELKILENSVILRAILGIRIF